MDDFEKARWKTADQLTVEDANLIVQHKDELNDEEKAAFAEVLLAAEPLSDNPLDTAIDAAVDNTIPPVEPVVPSPVVTPPADVPPPAAPVVPENVVTQDKLDTYLAEKKKEWDAAGKTAAEQEAEAKKVQTYFDAGYAPTDWNDYTNAMLEKVTPVIEARILATLDRRNAEFDEQQKKLRATQQEIYQKFEGEFATLATSKLIPDPKEKPEEYKKVHDAIIAIGDAHGKTNVTDAYKLYAIIPVEHGGGLVTTPGAAPVDPKAKIEAQKEAAGKIGSGRGAPGSQKPVTPAYNSIHNTRMEDLIDQRLQQP